jgi:exodeoxyribonuclease-3
MKIATYNVNGINGRLPRLLDWLARVQPDVVCLQELKTADERFPEAAIRDAGYGAAWRGQRAYNGVAILARDADPVVSRRALPGDNSDAQGRYIEAAVQGVIIGCLYAPNGNPQPGPKFDYKLGWMRRLLDHAQGLLDSGLPVVLAGDYNVVPTDDVADIYSPRSWKDDALLQPAPRAAFAELLAQGWTDAIRRRHPGDPLYTYWDYKRNRWPRDAGLRIDHLLLSRSVAKRLKDAGVDKAERGAEGASDHAPAWVTLKQ